MPSSDRITLPTDLQEFARESERALRIAERRGGAVALDAVPWLNVTNDELLAMPLTHEHGFVLSLVDGRSTVEMIADVSGLGRGESLALLAELVGLGALALRDR